MHSFHQNKKGFTLIELLVSMGLFSVVMMISIGTLLAIVDANKQARSLLTITTEMNFVFDSMMRTIRTGYGYDCGSGVASCPAGSPVLRLYDQEGRPIQYSFSINNNSIVRTVDGSAVEQLTSAGIRIEKMLFIVTGATPGEGIQPTVTLMVQASAGGDPDTNTTLNLQATVVQRALDL